MDGAADPFPMGKPFPCLGEREAGAGSARGHYFHQDLLVAQRIHEIKPRLHVDVGSRVDGFVTHVASFRPIEVFDIRPLEIDVPNISFKRADLMNPGQCPTEYCDSLSCLHALEHFGLGRYGDPIDVRGHLRGLESLHAILETGGRLYLSVPMGPQRVEFNAHRVFGLGYLLDLVDGAFTTEAFHYVDDAGDVHRRVPLTDEDVGRNYDCQYGCGILELVKSGASLSWSGRGV